MPFLEAVFGRSWSWQLTVGESSLWDTLGMYSWLSLIGPKLEAGTTIRETVSYYQVLTFGANGYGLTSWAGCCRWWVQVLSYLWSGHYPYVCSVSEYIQDCLLLEPA